MHLIDSPVWLALAWACLHFTWIGAVIGGVAVVTRFALRGAAPEVRCRAALGFLLALLVAPFATFFIVLSQSNPVVTAHGVSGGFVQAAPFAMPEHAHGWFDRFLFFVPWLWIAGALIKHLVIVAGWWGTERLRRDARVAVSDEVSRTCRRLARSLGVTRRVAVGFSDRVASPIVLGVVRPMILLPATLATGWVPERLEMILLHELAHVRRHDVLVHIVQRVTEALWFFHPAVWSVSRWLTLECEQCCDAFVLDRTGRPCAYARTLVALSGGVRSPAAATLGAAMADRHLVTRIRRILNQEETRMQIHPRATFAVVALLTTSLMVWNAYAQKQCSHCGHIEAESAVAQDVVDPIAGTDAPMPARLDDVTDILAVDPNYEAMQVPRAVIAGDLAIDALIAEEPAGAVSVGRLDPSLVPHGIAVLPLAVDGEALAIDATAARDVIAVTPGVVDLPSGVFAGDLAVATLPPAAACPPGETAPEPPRAPRATRHAYPEIAQGGGSGGAAGGRARVASGSLRRAPQAQGGRAGTSNQARPWRAPRAQGIGGGTASGSTVQGSRHRAPQAQGIGGGAGGGGAIYQRFPQGTQGRGTGGGGGALRRMPSVTQPVAPSAGRGSAGVMRRSEGVAQSAPPAKLRSRGTRSTAPSSGVGTGSRSGQLRRLEALGYRTPANPGAQSAESIPRAPRLRTQGMDTLPEDAASPHDGSRYWSDYWNRYWRDFYRAHPGIDPTSTNCSDCHQGLRQWKPTEERRERDRRTVAVPRVGTLRAGVGR